MDKLILTVCLVCTLLFAWPQNLYAECPVSVLKNLCAACEERALSKLNLDSICPKQATQEFNCPSISKACVHYDSFLPFLKQKYTISANIGGTNTLFYLNFKKNDDGYSIFNYDVRAQNQRSIITGATGYIYYDVVNFIIPLKYQDNYQPYSCIGIIDNTSTIKGSCTTTAKNGEGILTSYGWSFTALVD